MTEPLENVRVGMTGRNEVVVTRELTVGAHVERHAVRLRHPDDDPGDGDRLRSARWRGHLPPGWATVGSEVNVRHLAPTPMGRTVVATARVIEVSGRSILFAVEAHDGARMIGEGTHRRGAVNLDSFAKRFGAG